jgi:hypothetical protein
MGTAGVAEFVKLQLRGAAFHTFMRSVVPVFTLRTFQSYIGSRRRLFFSHFHFSALRTPPSACCSTLQPDSNETTTQ